MLCESPITLKSGLVVPCGKCLLCLSRRRDDWSTRMQLHSLYTDSQPFFCTFTYDDDHLVYGDRPTLYKRDFQLFVKRLKENYQLYHSDFAFVAAGEYGDLLERPHYHAILYGMPQLTDMYNRGFQYLNAQLSKVWQNGYVYCGPAETSGIHYTAKYVLKYIIDDYDGIQKPFILASKGIGTPWLRSAECNYLIHRLDTFRLRAVEVPDLDCRDFQSLLDSSFDAIQKLRKFYPKFDCTLADGRHVPLPSYLKQKVLGSFEHFRDNPMWLYDHINKIYQSCSYIIKYGDLDRETSLSHQDQILDFARRKIKQRLILKNQL